MQIHSFEPAAGKGYFLSQPHQPFFLFGVLWGIVDVALFALMYKGAVPADVVPQFFHAYSMIFSVFTQFFVGFIFTTFPRFCQSVPIERRHYLNLWALMQIGSLMAAIGSLCCTLHLALGSAFLFIADTMAIWQLFRIYREGKASRYDRDPFWILTGFVVGLGFHALFLLSFAASALGKHVGFEHVAATGGFWLYLAFTAFVVAQRMVPFFSHVSPEKTPRLLVTLLLLLAVKLIAGWVDAAAWEGVADLLLALFLLREYLRWKLPLFSSPAIVWVLYLALFWLPAALLLDAGALAWRMTGGGDMGSFGLHLAALGFLTTLLIGFGTRVTLGHSSQVPRADRYAVMLFWGIQAVAALRALYALHLGTGLGAHWLFDVAALSWIVLFLLWGIRYGPVLVRGKKLT